MKAVQFDQFGPPSVLQFRSDYPKPTCKSKEILIRVHASTVNPMDCAIRSGTFFGFMTAKPKVLGIDFSGTVEDANWSAKLLAEMQFKQGDKVFGKIGADVRRPGCYAEYVAVAEGQVAVMPADISFAAAAATPTGALTAWQALEKAGLKPGQRLLVQAASGGVGSWIVQLAKCRGLHVTGTCSTPNVSFVRQELGADDAIDYMQQKLLDVCQGRTFDAVIDSVGGAVQRDSYACLRGKGTFVEIMNPGTSKLMLASQVLRGMLGLGSSCSIAFAPPSGADLHQVAELLHFGRVTAHVDRVFPLAEAVQAHEYFETRKQTQGKIVLHIQD